MPTPKPPTIAELLAQLPTPPTPADQDILVAANALLKALKTPDPDPAAAAARVFTFAVRKTIAGALRAYVERAIKARKAPDPAMAFAVADLYAPGPKIDGRRISPSVAAARADHTRRINEVSEFKYRVLALDVEIVRFLRAIKPVMDMDDGQTIDHERRRKYLTPEVPRVLAKAAALAEAAIGGAAGFQTDIRELVDQTMPLFERVCARWMSPSMALGDSKAHNPTNATVIINLRATLRSLQAEAAQRIRELKSRKPG